MSRFSAGSFLVVAGTPRIGKALLMTKHTERARRLRRSQTVAESKLWRVLRGRGLNGRKFRRQWPIGAYVVDFACVEAKLVIEVDGATHGTSEEIAWDQQRTVAIEACGFLILRITNADIHENLDGVRETILAAVERRGTL